MKAGIDPFVVPLLWNPGMQLQYTDVGFEYDNKKKNNNDDKEDATSAPIANPKRISPCVTPQHEWIVSNRMAPFTGAEALALQGIPIPEKKIREKFTSKNLRDLAGNAMSTTVVGAAILAAMVAGASNGTKTD